MNVAGELPLQGFFRMFDYVFWRLVYTGASNMYLSKEYKAVFPPRRRRLRASVLCDDFVVSITLQFFGTRVCFLRPDEFLRYIVFLLLFQRSDGP